MENIVIGKITPTMNTKLLRLDEQIRRILNQAINQDQLCTAEIVGVLETIKHDTLSL